jgi:hypothetical protein
MYRSTLRRTIWLAALLLVLVQAVPMRWRMQCLMSGRSVLSWGRAESCMPDAPHGKVPTVNVTCCLFTHAGGERVEYVGEEAPNVVEPLAVALPWVLPQLMPEALPVVCEVHTRPPPLRGSDALVIRYGRMLI